MFERILTATDMLEACDTVVVTATKIAGSAQNRPSEELREILFDEIIFTEEVCFSDNSDTSPGDVFKKIY
jgi:hypothetical protein